jgi:hypothetical protein
MVKYTVKQGRAAENQRYIEDVFEELKATVPAGLHYASFKLDDGVTFVHVASIDTESGENPLFQSAAFTSFLADIEDRCEVQPVTQALHEVGSYAFHGVSYR